MDYPNLNVRTLIKKLSIENSSKFVPMRTLLEKIKENRKNLKRPTRHTLSEFLRKNEDFVVNDEHSPLVGLSGTFPYSPFPMSPGSEEYTKQQQKTGFPESQSRRRGIIQKKASPRVTKKKKATPKKNRYKKKSPVKYYKKKTTSLSSEEDRKFQDGRIIEQIRSLVNKLSSGHPYREKLESILNTPTTSSTSTDPSRENPLEEVFDDEEEEEEGEEEQHKSPFHREMGEFEVNWSVRDDMNFQSKFFHNIKKTKLTPQEKKLIRMTNLKREVTAYIIECTLANQSYTIRVFYVPGDLKKDVVITLHGFGKSSTKYFWAVLADRVFEQHPLLHVSLPGFGLSSGRTLQTRIYKRDHEKLLLELIKTFGRGENKKKNNNKAIMLAQCGGGGITMKTITKYPKYFAKKHFFGRPYNAVFPPNFIQTLEKHQITLNIFWEVDVDHSVHSVPYKFYSENARYSSGLAMKSPQRNQKKKRKKGKCSRIIFNVKRPGDKIWIPKRYVAIPKLSREKGVSFYDPPKECVDLLRNYFEL